MKKFKIIRNILIVVILIIAATYICLIRSSNIRTSKAYKLFISMTEGNNLNSDRQITMEISCDNKKIKSFIFIQATDEIEGQEISYISHKRDNMLPDEDGSGMVTVITNHNKKAYNIFPKIKKYRTIYTSEEGNRIDGWIATFISRLSDCKYYTKGYEFVNGKLLYYEKFKENNLKFYFDNDELVYIKDSTIDEGFDNVKNNLYSVKIKYDDSYKEYTEIPEDYVEYEVAEDM